MKISKIAHVTFDMRIGGAEQVICSLVENLNQSGYQVSILCIENHIGPFGENLMAKGFSVTSLERQPGFDFSLVQKIRKHIIKQNIDILHCHQYTPYVYGVLGALFTKCKVIFTEHGRFYPDLRKFKRIMINPVLSFFTSRITAISKATAKALVHFENFNEKKIDVIYNGMNSDRFFKTDQTPGALIEGIQKGAFVLGTVARLDSIKNQKIMIQALKQVREKYDKVILLMVGDGPERENLEQLARDLGLESHVIFTGFRQDTPLFYNIMDAFLLISFSEGTAMTLLEAMACGLPCIVSDVGGNPEIVVHNQTGLVIPSDDIHSLTKAITRLIESKDLREMYGTAGKNRFNSEFSIKNMIEKFEKLYEDVLTRG